MRLADEVKLTVPEIGTFLERLTALLEGHGVEARPTHDIVLMCEEILVNVAMHGGGENGVAQVRIAVGADHVAGEILDSGRSFDPTTALDPDVGAGIADRPVGGLGLFLVRRISSTFSHERIDGRNRTTFSVPRPSSRA